MNTEEIVYAGVKAGELEIDASGRIWRIASRCGAGAGRSILLPVPRKRAEYKHPRGYLFCSRKTAGKVTQALAHRLVWLHFNGPIPVGLTINHKNGIKDCNRPKNLELATHGEQAMHALHVIKTRVATAGERSWTAKLTEKDVADIRRRVGEGEYQKDLAVEYGVDASTISNAVHGVTWASPNLAPVKTTKTKLTADQMHAILAALKDGACGRTLAKEYQVSPACISRLKNGQTWKKLMGPSAPA